MGRVGHKIKNIKTLTEILWLLHIAWALVINAATISRSAKKNWIRHVKAVVDKWWMTAIGEWKNNNRNANKWVQKKCAGACLFTLAGICWHKFRMNARLYSHYYSYCICAQPFALFVLFNRIAACHVRHLRTLSALLGQKYNWVMHKRIISHCGKYHWSQ